MPKGSGCGPAAPATGGGRQTGTVPPLPHPREAAMRAMSAGAARSGTLHHPGSRRTPIGSGGGSGLVKAPAGVVGTPGAASLAPLRGAGTGNGGPPPTPGLPHTQPADSARPGAQNLARGGDHRAPPPPPKLEPTSAPARGAGGYGRRASMAQD